MSPKPYDRRFGVEIEFGFLNGFPEDFDELRRLFRFPLSNNKNPAGWTIRRDGTFAELSSPILKGRWGYSYLRWALEKLKKSGAYVTERDGMHIHHDAPEFTQSKALCEALVKSWLANKNEIYKMVAPRRRDNGACPSWSSYSLDVLRNWVTGHESNLAVGRYDLNLASLRKYGSVEIRLLEGTLDPDVAIAWIEFGQRLLHDVVTNAKPVKKAQNPDDLLASIQLSPEAIAILAEKRAHNHITPGSQYRGAR